jgi:hypothetical protein
MAEVTPNPGLPAQTIISQYSNSPTLVQLINNMDAYINPDTDFDTFFDFCFNVETARGFGLDNWGKVVGLENGRLLQIPDNELNLGFDEAGTASATTFGSGVLYSGAQVTQNFVLADDAFRTLILVKALANISNCTAASLNQLLQNLFAGRGRCYVSDLGKMQMRFTFEFFLQPFELAILTQSGAIPRPAAVQAFVMSVSLPFTFGFSEAGTPSAVPFGQGSFYTGINYTPSSAPGGILDQSFILNQSILG